MTNRRPYWSGFAFDRVAVRRRREERVPEDRRVQARDAENGFEDARLVSPRGWAGFRQ